MDKAVLGDLGEQVSAFPDVVIYTSNDCIWCVRAKEYMTQHGVGYTEKNVEENDAFANEAITLAGRRGTPVIVVGGQVVRGFQQQELDALFDFDVAHLE